MKCPNCGYDDQGRNDGAHFCRGLQSPGCIQHLPINPLNWLKVANACRPKLPHTTDWIDGTQAPVHIGWYERHFTDSMFTGAVSMHWWDGQCWKADPDAPPHWRQVGDYPCWRGLDQPFMPSA